MARNNRTARNIVALASAAVALCASCGSSDSTETTSSEDQIKAVTTEYTDAQSARDEAKLRRASCTAQIAREVSEFGLKSNPTKVTVDAITDIKVSDDKATAQVSMTANFASGKTEQQQGVEFTYVNEGGWKVCLS